MTLIPKITVVLPDPQNLALPGETLELRPQEGCTKEEYFALAIFSQVAISVAQQGGNVAEIYWGLSANTRRHFHPLVGDELLSSQMAMRGSNVEG